MTLSYNEKLVGLSLLKVADIERAAIAFADVMQSTVKDAVATLTNLQRNSVLLNGGYGIVSKIDNLFIFYHDHNESLIDEMFYHPLHWPKCNGSKRQMVERAIQMLTERG
jgi:hypothetical protein